MTLRMRRFCAALAAICLLALCAPISGAVASSKYYITVDLTNQIVTVYDSEKTDDQNIVRQMICSSGRVGTPTPTGTFTLPYKSQSSERSEWYYFPKFKCYAKWATRITGGILFHSTLFTAAKKGPTSTSTRALGSKASHGCIRLKVDDAKFIAQNCLAGTKVKIYSSGKTNASLRSKLRKKTFNRDNQTYDSYLGRKPQNSTIPLSKGSTGELVTQLQTRLKALGFYSGNVNGTLGKTTVTAVQAFEAAAGLGKTSKVDQALWDAIFSDGAITGTLVTLAKGSSGPAVTVLQTNLSTLLMLTGDIDGNYGTQTAKAVTSYQEAFGFSATGSADTELQNDIADRAAKVRADFGTSAYTLTTVSADARMAKVKAKYYTKLHKTASTKSKSLKKLKRNATMRVLNEGKTWTKVRSGSLTGYVKRSALSFYNETVEEKGYVLTDATPAPTAEPTPEPTDWTTVVNTDDPAATPTPTPEVYIPTPTPEVYIPASADSSQPVALEAGLIYGTEPVETPAPDYMDDFTDELPVGPDPTPAPTVEPTPAPTAEPTPEPTAEPTPEPAVEQAVEATPEPAAEPTIEAAPEPTPEEGPEPEGEGELLPGTESIPEQEPEGEIFEDILEDIVPEILGEIIETATEE